MWISQLVAGGTQVTVSEMLDSILFKSYLFWFLASEDISELLNYVELVTITNDECQDTYGVIRPEMICANSPSSQIRSSCSVSIILSFAQLSVNYKI